MTSHLVTLILIAFVWGMVAFAVIIDASRRDRHGGFWAVLTLLTGLFGAILYLLVVLVTSDSTDDAASGDGTDTETIRVCPACSSRYDDSRSHCEECGAELGPGDEHPVGRRLKTGSRRYCSNCKSGVGREASACPSCGAVFY